jgi:hypothetical protein
LERSYTGIRFLRPAGPRGPGRPSRRCPLADDLAAIAIISSRSRELDGRIAVQALILPGDYAWVEIMDQDDPRIERGHGDDRPHRPDKGARLAGHGS